MDKPLSKINAPNTFVTQLRAFSWQPGEGSIVDFLEHVSSCASSFGTRRNEFRAVASYLEESTEISKVRLGPFGLCIRLYAIGLRAQCTKKMVEVPSWLDEEKIVSNLTQVHNLLISAEDNDMKFRTEFKNLLRRINLLPESTSEAYLCTLDRWTYMTSYYSALSFLCDSLSDLVISESRDVLGEVKSCLNRNNLSPIQDTFRIFCNLFLFCSNSDKGSDILKLVVPKAAAATYTLSFTTKIGVKEGADFLREIISSEWIEDSMLLFVYKSLHNVAFSLIKSKRLQEALECVDLCCNAAWTRVSQHCGKTPSATTHIMKLVRVACVESGVFAELHDQCGRGKGTIFESHLEKWSVAERLLRNPPLPKRLVEQWVKMECKPFKGIGVSGATTLYSLLSSSEKFSQRARQLLLEQELQAYKELSTLNPSFCQKMKQHLIDILLNQEYIGNDFYLERSRILIAKASEARTCGAELKDISQCLSDAIATLELHTGTSSSNVKAFYQLADAYCLRALCTQEAQPSSQQIIKDIAKAVEIWSRSEAHQAGQSSIILMFNIIDMLSMKGCKTKVLRDIYKMIFKQFDWKENSKENVLAMMWQSRRLYHGICASSVDESFIETFSKHYQLEGTAENCFKSMEFWVGCMKTQALKVGFRLKFSFMCDLFVRASHPDDDALISDVTIEEIKEAVSVLVCQVPKSPPKAFLAACLYYDLAERLISNGLLNEALVYSWKAQAIREKTFRANFEHLKESSPCSFESLHMRSGISALDYRHETCDFESCYLTPWSSLRCFLESLLQLAMIHESLGNKSEAETMSRWGKDISSFQGFSVFLVAFSSLLGKLHLKQQKWDEAEMELRSAKNVLKGSTLPCRKCKLVFQVAIDQQLGDLWRSRNIGDDVKEAITVYESALGSLDGYKWRTPACDEEMPKSVCEVSGVDKTNCLHCLVLHVRKSGTISDFVLMKWEFTRRRLSLRLHAATGKCLSAQREIHNAHKHFCRSISLFISKSMIESAVSTFTPEFQLEFIGKEIVGDGLKLEHSAIIYMICLFSLQCSHGKATKGKDTSCCEMSCISITRIVSLLMQAFTSCREVPVLFQKVSRLLAIIYTASPMGLDSRNGISKSHLASFFHQASIGCHLNQQLRRHVMNRAMGLDSRNDISCRTVPESHNDLDGFISSFFKGLPRATVICISLLGDLYVNLVRGISDCSSQVHAWIMLSRFDENGQHETKLLPLGSITEDVSDKDGNSFSSGILYTDTSADSSCQWNCPWGHSVIDTVAPVFRRIVKRIHDTLSDEESKKKWRSKGTKMKTRELELQAKELKRVDNEWEKSWFGDEWKRLLETECNIQEVESSLSSSIDSKPIILVLDSEVLVMLPWENLPVLRTQNVCRMPSVASMFYTLRRWRQREQDKKNNVVSNTPQIDPLDAYYLINPSRDLPVLQKEIEEWLRNNNIREGIAGAPATSEELVAALSNHDLYIYVGHDGGGDYISPRTVRNLDRCGAAFLFGCSSSCLLLYGHYAPCGAPLDYILGGCPHVIGSLWVLNSKDTIRFAKSLIKGCLRNAKKPHKSTMSSSVRWARKDCKLPFVTGASFVCYGVPTDLIDSKKL